MPGTAARDGAGRIGAQLHLKALRLCGLPWRLGYSRKTLHRMIAAARCQSLPTGPCLTACRWGCKPLATRILAYRVAVHVAAVLYSIPCLEARMVRRTCSIARRRLRAAQRSGGGTGASWRCTA